MGALIRAVVRLSVLELCVPSIRFRRAAAMKSDIAEQRSVADLPPLGDPSTFFWCVVYARSRASNHQNVLT
jgi:hypothetical protein